MQRYRANAGQYITKAKYGFTSLCLGNAPLYRAIAGLNRTTPRRYKTLTGVHLAGRGLHDTIYHKARAARGNTRLNPT